MYKCHCTIVVLVILTLWQIIALQKYHMEKHATQLLLEMLWHCDRAVINQEIQVCCPFICGISITLRKAGLYVTVKNSKSYAGNPNVIRFNLE